MKYEEKHCDKCNEETVHRIFKRYGRKKTGGAKMLKRVVCWCMKCQKRIISK